MKLKIEEVARICHETNKAFCEINGDFSQAQWAQSPGWQKASAVNGVQFAIDNPEATAEDSHSNWLAVKEKEGWSYSEVKDPANLKHPCMLPYGELPEDQRIKDALFQAVCKTCIPFIKKFKVVTADKAITPETKKVKMNPADEEAMAMDGNKPVALKPKLKELPSGRATPKIA